MRKIYEPGDLRTELDLEYGCPFSIKVHNYTEIQLVKKFFRKYEVIMNAYNFFKDIHSEFIFVNYNHHVSFSTAKPYDKVYSIDELIKPIEKKEPKIKWFKGGKLNESFHIGQKVKVISEDKIGKIERIGSIWCSVKMDDGRTLAAKNSHLISLDVEIEPIEKVEQKIKWFKDGKLEKFNDFNNKNIKLQENNDTDFKKGDRVIVNNNLIQYIQKYDWGESMYELIGNTYEIEFIIYDDEFHQSKYYLKCDDEYYVFKDCITLADDNKIIKVKWFKKGEFNKGEITNELFGTSRMEKAITGDRLKHFIRQHYGDKARVVFIEELKERGKKLIDSLKEELIGKRVQFYYDFDRGIDGPQVRAEIMTIMDIESISFFPLKKCIFFVGAPEISNMNSICINRNHPIAILPDVKREYRDDDPYNEERWD